MFNRDRKMGPRFRGDDDGGDDDLEILRISAEVERAQSERLAQFRTDRDQQAVDASLDTLRAASRADQNLVPVIMDAVRTNATIGEICQAMKDVFGTYREPPVI